MYFRPVRMPGTHDEAVFPPGCSHRSRPDDRYCDRTYSLGPFIVGRYVGVLKKFSSHIEGCVIEGQMDPAVVGKFKMTPLVTSMAKDLKKVAEAKDTVRDRPGSLHEIFQ